MYVHLTYSTCTETVWDNGISHFFIDKLETWENSVWIFQNYSQQVTQVTSNGELVGQPQPLVMSSCYYLCKHVQIGKYLYFYVCDFPQLCDMKHIWKKMYASWKNLRETDFSLLRVFCRKSFLQRWERLLCY